MEGMPTTFWNGSRSTRCVLCPIAIAPVTTRARLGAHLCSTVLFLSYSVCSRLSKILDHPISRDSPTLLTNYLAPPTDSVSFSA
jgi:hypothetical protein